MDLLMREKNLTDFLPISSRSISSRSSSPYPSIASDPSASSSLPSVHFQSTKSSELDFSALLGTDGTRYFRLSFLYDRDNNPVRVETSPAASKREAQDKKPRGLSQPTR